MASGDVAVERGARLAPEEREALIEMVRRLLQSESSEAAVRRAMETKLGFDRALWARLADVGIIGLLIGVSDGGSGLGPVELELVMEEIGAALLCAPLFSSGVLAAALVAETGDRSRLRDIASGKTIATVAVTGPTGTWTETAVDVFAHDYKLNGTSGYVTDAEAADLLLVVARGETGIEIYEVDRTAPGLTVEPLPVFDRSRRLATVLFKDVKARLIGAGWPIVERALDYARVAIAGEAAGGAREMLNRTVAYTSERYQFGRSVGSFQAIKHMAADLLLETESAISAARHAAEELANGQGDANGAISLASFTCPDAFVETCAASIQMHGGIAFTWEHPAHLYLRRARAAAQLLGTSSFYRERYVQRLEAVHAAG